MENGSTGDNFVKDVTCQDETVLDPRVKVELETLNAAADSVNRLENELQTAQVRFIRDKTIYTQQLEALRKRIGDKHIIRAQPYYELLIQSSKLQMEVRRSAEKYHAACEACVRSKQTLVNIEQSISAAADNAAASVSAEQQESLNRATDEFMKAEKTRLTCEREHQMKAKEHLSLQQKVVAVSKEIAKTLRRAKPFYDLKEQLESKLQILKQYAEDIALALTCNKQRYQLALDKLESISDELHEQRRLVLPPRTPGVGAEAGDDLSSWPSVNIDVVGMHFETEHSTESHATSSYCDIKTSVGDAAASMLEQFCVVDVPDQSLSSHLTAEEIIQCASETVALKQMSDSSLLTSGSEAVSCPEIPYRDNQIDGAEDVQENAFEQSEPVGSIERECDAQLKATDCSPAIESSRHVSTSITQKTVAVAALPSGVYITKPSPATDNKVSVIPVVEGCDSAISERDRRRLQLQKQFPILHDLGQRP